MAASSPSKLTKSKEDTRTFLMERIAAGRLILPKLNRLARHEEIRELHAAVESWHTKNVKGLERPYTQSDEHLQYRNTQVPPDEANTVSAVSGYGLMERRIRYLERLLDSLDLYDEAEPPPPQPLPMLDSLHPEIQKRCRGLYENRHYSEAILSAFKVVEDTIRTKIGAKPEVVGKELISRAMKKTAPLIVLSKVEPEQDSAHLLYMGAIGFFRNPEAHRFTDINDPVKALETISFASILMRLLDEAEVREPEPLPAKPKAPERSAPKREQAQPVQILFEDRHPFVQTDDIPDGERTLHQRWVRVGVHNPTDTRLDHVSLHLEKQDPYNAFQPIPLAQKDDIGPGLIGTREEFAIPPHATVYVDVANRFDDPPGTEPGQIRMRYARPCHNLMAPGTYRLLLRAYGAGRPVEKTFLMAVEDGRLTFRVLEEGWESPADQRTVSAPPANETAEPAPVPSDILDSLGRLLANAHEASMRVLVDVRSNLTALQMTRDQFERRFRESEHHFDNDTRKLISDCIVCLNGAVGYFRLYLEHPNAAAESYEGTAEWRARMKLVEFHKLREEIVSRFHRSRGAT